MSARSDLKNRLISGQPIVAPGAYDPISARLIQSLGFDTVYTGGYMSGAHLAVTEPLMTLTEQVDVAARVARSVSLPVICDANAGYGDPVHAMHTVRTFEAAGIAAIHIEDQFFPKRASYHAGLEHVIPGDEFLVKMKYALQARTDPDFIIIGRTDAFSAVEGDMNEAIRRGNALRDLGVDVIMPRGVRQKEDLDTYRKGVSDVPLLVIAGADDITVQEYTDLGYQIMIYATAPIIAAVDGFRKVYQSLKDTGHIGINEQRVREMRDEVEALISLPEYQEVEAQTTEREFQDRPRH
ncbi:MAG: isocitrate lyase/PEP mutase family protein [Dehalococcoidia bacterium]|nr:isocitrate lyase/PEP mutase family protein [Dehalococcoidia bacterium]MDP7085191.1 isocitrate lyase/PEP mutase family protein [Dehalococcoidia bacterium]MDP7200546.1 isocitrate lyase/PEP mutase family protein [Dehalococcoidia bacterium]MDP7511811.1 isocitrate lyase/PEP mutase family protein [Dehalococcoidia bacterium]HJN86799.1 isocitrate lyase/PEP mutase family protein [Dehalococcoidia bacterium]